MVIKQEDDEAPRRKSTRNRSMSELYVSVECRPRFTKKRVKRMPVKIKLEPLDEFQEANQVDFSPEQPLPSPPRKETKPIKTKSPDRKAPKIKEEPLEEPSTSTYPSSIDEDFNIAEQNIKKEPAKPRKRRKKTSFSDSAGFKCQSCGRVYKYRKGLIQHQRVECNLEPQFACPYCPEKYRYRHQIRNHVFESHNQAFIRWYNLYYTTNTRVRHSDSQAD